MKLDRIGSWLRSPIIGPFFGTKVKAPNPYAPCMVYLPTFTWVIFRANDGKYSSTMEHMGKIGQLGKRARKTDGSNDG